MIFVIVTNKSALYEKEIDITEEGKKFADDNNCLFFETSAMLYEDIENVFQKLIVTFVDKL